ncbi:MAG: glycosyltransferase family 4 protein [Bacteroidota bacterium]|nr:glycosyltransferase family 4 protein [Bacteroidota bacterium]
MHVLHTFSNNSSVPYLTWFAERAEREGNIRYTFLNLYPEQPEMMDEMRRLGFECRWIGYDQNHRRSGMLKALPQLWRYMQHFRPDIVHCNLFDDTVPGLIAARLAGIKIRITTRQDTGFHWMHAPRWVAWDRKNTQRSTHLIAISEESRRFLIEKEKTPAEKITLVHNGIPPDRFTKKDERVMEDLRSRFGANGRFPIIGTVARFIEWKGYRQIVEVAGAVTREFPDALFLLCGEGDQRSEIEALVKEKGLDRNVVFTGWIDRKYMASFYGILDVYLHAAVLEPFGLVYAEAMMNGVTVVSTPTGAALDAIESGKNGFLAERNADALGAAVHKALVADRKEVGAAGRRTALEKFNFDVMWNGTTDLYRNAIASL